MDAVESAQKRNEERDAARKNPTLLDKYVIDPYIVQPLMNIGGGGSDDDPEREDTRTPEQKYRDAFANTLTSKIVTNIPIAGPAIGFLNNRSIAAFERENPQLSVADPGKFYQPAITGILDALGITSPQQRGDLGFAQAGQRGYEYASGDGSNPTDYGFSSEAGFEDEPAGSGFSPF